MPDFKSLPGDTWPASRLTDLAEPGAPFDAFPVEADFRVRPDLAKLMPVDDWLRLDREWAPMLQAKLAALASEDNIMLASAGEAPAAAGRLAAVRRAAEKLAPTASGSRLGIQCAGRRIRFASVGYQSELCGHFVRLSAQRDDAALVVQTLARHADEGAEGALLLLGALAMSLQEDLVLMERGADGIARAVLFHVSFPSAWNPAEKLGQDLLALHAPVADNALLQAAAGRLGNAVVEKGPFVRWVWTVTSDPRWRAWPPQPHTPQTGLTPPPHAGTLYFRLERQTTMPLGDGYGLFLIRVQVRPLDAVLATPGRLQLLQASLRSMSDDMVRYKSLAAVRARLLQL